MSFLWPVMLFSLVLVPLFVILYLALQRRRRRLAASYGRLGFVQGALGGVGGQALGARRHIPPALFLAGLTALLVALARPQAVLHLPREAGTVILAFDISGSMAADDLEPTRMEAAKLAARAFVQRQPASVQIGVVAFSDGGFAVQAPTNDQETILAAIARLAPQRGTALAHGIQAALAALAASAGQAPEIQLPAGPGDPTALPVPTPTPVPDGTYLPAVIVLLSDGENNEPPDPLAAAQAAADQGVRIYTVGIGSAAGANLDIDGFSVHTRLDEALLQAIARLTDGAYYNAGSEADLQAVYANLRPQWVVKPEPMEITSILAGASLLALLGGGFFSLLWFNRLP